MYFPHHSGAGPLRKSAVQVDQYVDVEFCLGLYISTRASFRHLNALQHAIWKNDGARLRFSNAVADFFCNKQIAYLSTSSDHDGAKWHFSISWAPLR